MSARRTCAPIPAVLAGMFLVGCGACSDRAQEEPQVGNAAGKGQDSGTARAGDKTEPREIPELVRKLWPGTRMAKDWYVVAGEVDAQNRFPAAAIVVADPPSPEGVLGLCSGVLVAPQLVLTAGNCICERRKQPAVGGVQRMVIDATSCAKSATVTIAQYEPPTATEPAFRGTYVSYVGPARPHPGLKIVLDEQENIISSEADLAVIQLGVPPLGRSSPVALADVDLRVNESLDMVGFDALPGTASPKRRFRQNHVIEILDDGARALFDAPKREGYKGDSGGPCVRETDRGMVLAGILNRSLGAEPSFTSTFHYRDWIRQEIQRAASDSHSPR